MRSIQRVVHNTTDVSEAVNDFRTGAAAFAYTTGEYLYVGAEVPFNQLWIEPGVANAAAAAVSVDVWWAQAWTPVVDLVDGTRAATAPLAQAGRVQWSLNIQKGWDREDESARVTGLDGTAIYWMYWLRMSWTQTLTPGATLKYLGQRFSSDNDLYGYYPDLNNAALKASFAANKVDWNEQAYMAAEIIARDLIGRKIILARGQIFDHSRVLEPSAHKTAELIYRGLGRAFEPNRVAAARDYAASMNRDFFRVDANADGHFGQRDKRLSTSFMTR